MCSAITSSLWGSSSTKTAGSSEVWRKANPEDFEEQPDGPPERIASAEERSEQLNLDYEPTSAVCVQPSGTSPPHGVQLTSAGRGNPNLQNVRINRPTLLISAWMKGVFCYENGMSHNFSDLTETLAIGFQWDDTLSEERQKDQTQQTNTPETVVSFRVSPLSTTT